EQIPKVKEGQQVLLATPSNERISGRISSVGSVVDNDTKTLHVRVIADNPRGILRPGMFVTAEILLGSSTKTALLVPESAIVTYKDRPYVYMHHIGEGHFEPSAIGVGIKAGGLVEVTSGLHEGDLVVVSGATQLLAQSVLKPEAEHQHQGEKHSDHHGHQEAETHKASSSAQIVMGFALGLGATFLIVVAWVLMAKLRKKSED
ncbi:MAG: efflux RND transporter periplasmic adaptor subunit, partial [Methylococcales bacterium]|nr:efflux RND transporter periplasmic adaptor subunit [Methylococcales bacterium]